MKPYKSLFNEGIESEKVGDNKFYFTNGRKKVFLDKKFKQLLKGVNANMSLEDAGKKIEDNMLEYEDTHEEPSYEGMELSIKIGQTEYFYSDGWEKMKESLVRKKSLKENVQLRPFSNSDYRAYSGVEVPSNGSPMIGFFDLIIDREYQPTFDNLGISFEDFKNTAVIVDAKNIYVMPNTSQDVVFSKKLGFGWNAMTNAINLVSKTFRDGITINDLFQLDFQSSIDL